MTRLTEIATEIEPNNKDQAEWGIHFQTYVIPGDYEMIDVYVDGHLVISDFIFHEKETETITEFESPINSEIATETSSLEADTDTNDTAESLTRIATTILKEPTEFDSEKALFNVLSAYFSDHDPSMTLKREKDQWGNKVFTVRACKENTNRRSIVAQNNSIVLLLTKLELDGWIPSPSDALDNYL